MSKIRRKNQQLDCRCNLLDFLCGGVELPAQKPECLYKNQKACQSQVSQKAPSFQSKQKFSVSRRKKKLASSQRSLNHQNSYDTVNMPTSDGSKRTLASGAIRIQIDPQPSTTVEVGQINNLLSDFRSKLERVPKKSFIQSCPQSTIDNPALRKVECIVSRQKLLPSEILVAVPDYRNRSFGSHTAAQPIAINIQNLSEQMPTKCEPHLPQTKFNPTRFVEVKLVQPSAEEVKLKNSSNLRATLGSSDDFRMPKSSTETGLDNRQSIPPKTGKVNRFRTVLSESDDISAEERDQSIVIGRSFHELQRNQARPSASYSKIGSQSDLQALSRQGSVVGREQPIPHHSNFYPNTFI